ncbi:MAG: hypothetical protein AABW92_05000 [Nanoarchaeota archaeon]
MASTARLDYKKFEINKKWVFLGLLVWITSFFIDIWPIIFLTFFCIINSVMLSFKRYFDAPVDPEFSTFSAILMTVQYGLIYGILAGILTKFVSMMYIKNIKVNYFFMMTGYVVAAFLANIFRGYNVVVLGLIVTLLANTYLFFVRKFIVNYSAFEIFSYTATNIIFNFVLFLGFSEFFIKIMI